jgi:predicted RNase H-like nuclease (RuvC/YqgF family)
MNTLEVINKITRLNKDLPRLIEELEQNNIQLERSIDNADSNWHDEVKERFFRGPVTNVRQAHKSQITAMNHIKSEFESVERQIFSMI